MLATQASKWKLLEQFNHKFSLSTAVFFHFVRFCCFLFSLRFCWNEPVHIYAFICNNNGCVFVCWKLFGLFSFGAKIEKKKHDKDTASIYRWFECTYEIFWFLFLIFALVLVESCHTPMRTLLYLAYKIHTFHVEVAAAEQRFI